MATRTAEICSVMTALVWVVVMVAIPALAHQPPLLPPPAPTAGGGFIPFIGEVPPGAFADVQKCWSSFQSIDGCAQEIFRCFLGHKTNPWGLGPACCNAITTINDSCWPKMFPFNPFFPPLLNYYCTMNGGAAASIPPPAKAA